MALEVDSKYGLWYRPNTYDQAIIRSMNGDYLNYLKIYPEDRVLDIGANIGAFAARVRGMAKSVVCFEPDKRNYKLLNKNKGVISTKGSITTISCAVTRHDNEDVKLYRNQGTNYGSHSLIPMRGRRGRKVPGMSIEEVFVKLGGFEIVKIDIEGYEYSLLQDFILPWPVTQLAIEFHLNRMEWRNTLAPQLLKWLKKQKFRTVKKPKLTGKNWYSVGVFKR